MKKKILKPSWLIIILAVFIIAAAVFALLKTANPTLAGTNDRELKSTQSGVTMYVAGSRQEGDYYRVDLCFTLPDDRDWGLAEREEDAVLAVDWVLIPIREEGWMSTNLNEAGEALERCKMIRFPVQVQDGAQLKLTVQKIYVALDDVLDCPALQAKLDAKDSGLVIDCINQPHVSGFDVVVKPEGMTDIAARLLANEIITEAIRGPWIFEFAAGEQ